MHYVIKDTVIIIGDHLWDQLGEFGAERFSLLLGGALALSYLSLLSFFSIILTLFCRHH